MGAFLRLPRRGRERCGHAARAGPRARGRSAPASRRLSPRSAPASRCWPLICSRVTPGWMRDDRHLLASAGPARRSQRSVTSLVGPLVLIAEPGAVVAALAVAERGDEVELVDEAARRLPHDDEDLAAGDRDLRRAAAAGQPHLRLVVGADHRGVEIGEAVDLRAAEEADRDAPALQPVAEHLRHRRRWSARCRTVRRRRSTAAARPAWCRWCRTRRSA